MESKKSPPVLYELVIDVPKKPKRKVPVDIQVPELPLDAPSYGELNKRMHEARRHSPLKGKK